MKITILMSSPRKNGNTKQCLDPFCDELKNWAMNTNSSSSMTIR